MMMRTCGSTKPVAHISLQHITVSPIHSLPTHVKNTAKNGFHTLTVNPTPVPHFASLFCSVCRYDKPTYLSSFNLPGSEVAFHITRTKLAPRRQEFFRG